MNEKPSRQEVFFPNGKPVFSTDDPRAMYSEETLRSMVNAGYIVKVDGKRWRGARKK